MSNFLFIHNPNQKYEVDKIESDINLSETFHVEAFQKDENVYAVASLSNSPLKGKRIFKHDNWIILFAGDLIEYESIPYHKFIEYVENQNFEKFKDFNGIYSIFLFDRKQNKIFIISDRRSQHPAYYYIKDKKIISATDLSLFVKLIDNPEFEKKWLYDYLFFNYPIGNTTFLKEVYKIPPASCLVYDLKSFKLQVLKYAEFFNPKNKLLSGMKSFEYAKKILQERVPKYFFGGDNITCALTGGWDGRTSLALAPSYHNITAYTYGTPGCSDLIAGKKITDKLNIKFKPIYFDGDFVKNLPELLLNTIYLSSGLQSVLRSTLLYTFKTLAYDPSNFNLLISGINYDALFRGHFGIPAIISSYIAPIMKTGVRYIDKNFWSEIVQDNPNEFINEIDNKLHFLKSIFGDFHSNSHHLSYFVYFAGSSYYNGEIKIASNFITTRVPGWDNEIIDTAYSIKEAGLSFSELGLHKRGKRVEMEVQSYVFKKLAPDFYKLPVRNTKPNFILYGEFPYQLYKFYSRAKGSLNKQFSMKKKISRLEDWDYWLNKIHIDIINDLIFQPDSIIKEYINNQYLEKLKKERDIQMIGKLATTEIILRLIKNKWERFW